MNFSSIAKQAERYVVNNSPAIMTGIGVAGTVVTAVLSYRAGRRIGVDMEFRRIYTEMDQPVVPPVSNTKEFVETYWPDFIPPIAMGALSVAAIIGANRVGSRRAAAVAAAYSLTEKAFEEYRGKIAETLSEKKSQKIRDDIAQDRVDKDPVSTKEVIITGNGDVLCYDTLTGRYFMSSQEKIRAVVNEINRRVISYDYAGLSEFYDLLGLSATSFSEEVGWKFDNMIDISFSTVLSEDGKPCLAIQYNTPPGRNYYKLQ